MDKITKQTWKKRYRDRLIKSGLTLKEARESTNAIDMSDIDLEIDDPEMMADDELSYWSGN
jgi:hypothetical protein